MDRRYITIVLEYEGTDLRPTISARTKLAGGTVIAFSVGDRLTYELKAKEILEKAVRDLSQVSNEYSK